MRRRVSRERTAAGLLAAVGLLPDGPLPWGRPVPARGPGVYVVELPGPLPSAPIELTRVGKWLERVESLRLDGARPTSKALAARLAAFWLPDEVVLYVGMTTASIGGRVGAYYHTPLGDRKPHAGGHWLKALRDLDRLRVWWTETDAPEEYEDAILTAFADGVPVSARAALHDSTVVLPFANLRTATGERRQHGLSGTVLAEPDAVASPPTRIVEVPAGNADGAVVAPRGTGTTRRTGSPVARGTARPDHTTPARAPARAPRVEIVDLTAEALERLKLEHRELTHLRRPEVVARIKAARELGDLRENAEYHAAREEQSFLEGRVRLLDDKIRHARVIEPGGSPQGGGSPQVRLGSTVTVEHDGETMTFSLVGSTEAKPAKGRISSVSPVGAALLGKRAGDVVDVRTPRGAARYRIVELG